MTVPRRTLLTGSLGVAALAACGRTESPTAGPGAAGSAVASGPPRGELTMWAMGAKGDTLGDFVKAFTTSNPDLKVHGDLAALVLGARQVRERRLCQADP
jgi:multiple sugar transport system substrate-binding protein